MSTSELATGWVIGLDPAVTLPSVERRPPRQCLEDRLAGLLEQHTVFISFSGGRDSSLLLGIAVAVSRRHGLPLPIPLTLSYADDDNSAEYEWQDLVADSLGVTIERLSLTDESDLLHPHAVAVLERHGVCWSPGMMIRLPSLFHTAGAVLVTGEGGDEVLGGRRISPLTRALDQRVIPRGDHARAIGYAVAPAALRRRILQKVSVPDADDHAWVREPLRSEFYRALNGDAAQSPISHNEGTFALGRRRALTVALQHQELLAEEIGVQLVHPLVEAPFLAALARRGGRFGRHWTSRTQMMTELADGDLPTEVLSRTSKAFFNSAAINRHSVDFARGWDGTGLDDDLIVPAVLKAEWLSEFPSAGSFGLLQAARLAAA